MAEVMDEIIKMSKDIVAMDSDAAKMGLSNFEYAFYSAMTDNDSARELMQKDMLRKLAVVLTERVRENVSIDWTIKEGVRSDLKVAIKRTLRKRKYGYSLDMKKLARLMGVEEWIKIIYSGLCKTEGLQNLWKLRNSLFGKV